MYPIFFSGIVVSGFGRGSTELGFPTANLDISNNNNNDIARLKNGVYYGFSKLENENTKNIMVMSLGDNPFYKNTERSLEVHVIQTYDENFYGELMEINILGYIRSMDIKFNDLSELKSQINSDIIYAKNKIIN
jgi:riboflavin kinase